MPCIKAAIFLIRIDVTSYAQPGADDPLEYVELRDAPRINSKNCSLTFPSNGLAKSSRLPYALELIYEDIDVDVAAV